jgi:hypothetical protein
MINQMQLIHGAVVLVCIIISGVLFAVAITEWQQYHYAEAVVAGVLGAYAMVVSMRAFWNLALGDE